MNYLDILKEVDRLLSIDTTELRLLSDKLNGLDILKYKITDYLINFERSLLGSNLEMLEAMLDESKRYTKVLSSSTLTKDVLNAKSLNQYARYRKMQEYLRNIRGSIEVARTSLSLEKNLASISKN